MLTMGSNQRKTFRFKPNKSAFAALDSRLNQVGKIVDISLGGLSFEYICEEQLPEGGRHHVDIFTLDNSYTLSKLPCKLVHQSNVPVSGAKADEAAQVQIRRCGLQYSDLQAAHWCNLAEFLENHTSKDESCIWGIEPSEEIF